MDKVDAVFFIGSQGSGKGTQAKLLAKTLNFFYWEMSSVIRESANSGNEKGHHYMELINSGTLLSDADIANITLEKLASIPEDQGIVFDGVPRKIAQAEFIVSTMRNRNQKNLVTVLLDLPKEESLTRLLKRAETQGRADDTREKIEFRLEQYYNDTVPMLEFMRQETKFITVDGRPGIADVTASINKELDI